MPADTSANRVAVPVATFLDSLGICIHYAQGIPVESYLKPLTYLGVHNIRDDFGPPESYVSLHEAIGVKAVLIADTTSLDRTLAGFRRLAEAGALLAIEGPNEPNNFPITYMGTKGGGYRGLFGGSADWTAVAAFQRDLYAAVRKDAVLGGYPVFHVSEAGAQSPNVGLQYLKIPADAGATFPEGTGYADYANVHNYVSSTRSVYVDNQAWNAADPVLDSFWDGLYGEYGKLWGHGYAGYSDADLENLPRVTTETGWDSVSGIGGERVQGTVLLNTYLPQFRRGWRYTFIYMLRDGEGGSGNQGLYHADSTPKPAATYIHNMTAILDDKGSPARPGRLNYALEGQTSTMHDLLLQDGDGSFALVVWNERISGLDRVEVKLGEGLRHVRVFDPTIGTDPTETHQSVDRLSLSLGDHPLILKID